MPPLRMAYGACMKQMITIAVETSSGVPLTGLLNTTLPMTSATTRNDSTKPSDAAKTSSAFDVQLENLESMENPGSTFGAAACGRPGADSYLIS